MILTVSFDLSDKDEHAVCVMRQRGTETECLKVEIGEQADILYKALTDQSFKIEKR